MRRLRTPASQSMQATAATQSPWRLTGPNADQARHSCVNIEPGRAAAWPSAINHQPSAISNRVVWARITTPRLCSALVFYSAAISFIFFFRFTLLIRPGGGGVQSGPHHTKYSLKLECGRTDTCVFLPSFTYRRGLCFKKRGRFH